MNTHLFHQGDYTFHSGSSSKWKLECEALTEADWETIAFVISEKFVFGEVFGVPRGGMVLQTKLQKYATNHSEDPVLIVDDVMTTGKSMEELLSSLKIPLSRKIHGVVLFCRDRTTCPAWVHPIFTMW